MNRPSDRRAQLPPGADAQLAVDVARVGAHRLDADVQRGRDLGVGAPALQQLQDVGLARGQRGRPGRLVAGLAGRGEHVHPARGEVDGVQHVARLGVLGQAGGGPEPDHLAALGRRRVVGQHHQPDVGEAGVQVAQLRRARQRREVEDRHVGLVHAQGGVHLLLGDVGRHQAQMRIAVDQRLQTTIDDVLELRDRDVDRLAGGDAQLRRVWVCGPLPQSSAYEGGGVLTPLCTPNPPKFTPKRGRKFPDRGAHCPALIF